MTCMPVSNVSNALDKLRFVSVTEPNLLKDDGELDIRIQTDKDNGIITITDSGIGMTREELVRCLGTIAESGTTKFLKALKTNRTTARIFPAVLDVENPEFKRKSDRMVKINKKLIPIGKEVGCSLVKNLKKVPLVVALANEFLAAYLMPPTESG